MRIEEVTEVTDKIAAALQRLIPQLSTSNPPPSEKVLAEIVASANTVLLVARDPEQNNS